MQDPHFSAKTAKLKRRLTAIFLLAAALITAGGFAYHLHYRAALRKDASYLLSSILKSKTDQIVFWREDRITDTTSLLDTPVLSVFLDKLAADPGDAGTRAAMKDRLLRYLKHNPYRCAMLVKPDGKIVVSAGDAHSVLPPESMALLRKAAASGRTELGDIFLQPDGLPRLDVAALAARAGDRKLYLVLEISPSDYLYPLLREWPVPSASGEMTLSRLEGDNIVVLNELRFMDHAPIRSTSPFTGSQLPAARALRGETGVITATDYRGRKVLAALGRVPGTDWAIVAKMDLAEALSKAGSVSALLLLLTLSLVLGAGGFAYLTFLLQTSAYEKDLKEVESERERYKFSYETLSDKANDMILLSDPEKRTLLMVNHKTCEAYGYTEEEMLRRRPEDLMPPENLQAFYSRFKALADGASMTYETVHMRKNGERFPLEVSATGVRQGGRDLVYFTCRDITERKRLENELREKERRLAGIMYNMPGMAYRCANDPKWTMEFVSNGCEDLTGYKPAELLDRGPVSYSDLIVPEDRDRVWREVQTAVAAGRPYRMIYRIRRKDGVLRSVWEQGSQINGADGEVPALEGLIIDNSAKAAAEEALRESEERYRFLFEHNPMPMLIYERGTLRLLAVNEVFLKHYGYTRKEALSLGLTDLYPEDEKQRITGVASALRGLVNVGEWHHRRKDGTFITIIAQSHDLNYKGRSARVAVMTDITKIKQDELRMAHLNAELTKNLRLYTVLAQINQAAAHTRDRGQLYARLCETAVHAGGFRMAWIGQPDRDTGRVLPVCSAGEGAEEYLDAIKIAITDGPNSKGPTAAAAKSGKIAFCGDIAADPLMEPWRARALKLGYRSSAAIPLLEGDKPTAVLSLYSPEKDFFSPEELSLLGEIKADISLALEAISTENRRLAAQSALERTATHLTHVMEVMPVMLFSFRIVNGRFITQWVSGNTRNLTGHDQEEILTPGWFEAAIHPEDKLWVREQKKDIFKKGSMAQDFRVRKKDGSGYIWVHSQLKASPNGDGEITGSWVDITQMKESELRLRELLQERGGSAGA